MNTAQLTPEALLPQYAAKLVFSDLDGTVLPDGGSEVSEPVREAVARLRSRGLWFVPITGRSVLGTVPIGQQLGLGRGEFFVASNGAVTGQFTGTKRSPFSIVSMRTFDPAAAFTVARVIAPLVKMAVEVPGEGWLVNEKFPEHLLNGRQRRVRRERRLWAEEVTRAVVHAPGIATYVPNIVGTGVTAYPNGSDWIDITKAGLDKATEADWLRVHWSIHPDDVAGTGDGVNDIPLLDQVGYAGAMGHAPQQVKERADVVVGPVTEHGAVEFFDSIALSTREPHLLPILTKVGAR